MPKIRDNCYQVPTIYFNKKFNRFTNVVKIIKLSLVAKIKNFNRNKIFKQTWNP